LKSLCYDARSEKNLKLTVTVILLVCLHLAIEHFAHKPKVSFQCPVCLLNWHIKFLKRGFYVIILAP